MCVFPAMVVMVNEGTAAVCAVVCALVFLHTPVDPEGVVVHALAAYVGGEAMES